MTETQKGEISRILSLFAFLMFSVLGSGMFARSTVFLIWVPAATLALYSAFVFLKKKRVPTDLPTSKIRSAQQGIVELKGVAARHEQSFALPWSKDSVLWFEYTKEKRVRSGNQTKWKTEVSLICDSPICLDDGTGKVLINPHQMERIGLSQSRQTAHQRSFLGMGVGPLYRHTESFIREGDPLYAAGDLSLAKTEGISPSLPLLSYSKARALGFISCLHEDLLSRQSARQVGWSIVVLIFGVYALFSALGHAPTLIGLIISLVGGVLSLLR